MWLIQLCSTTSYPLSIVVVVFCPQLSTVVVGKNIVLFYRRVFNLVHKSIGTANARAVCNNRNARSFARKTKRTMLKTRHSCLFDKAELPSASQSEQDDVQHAPRPISHCATYPFLDHFEYLMNADQSSLPNCPSCSSASCL